MNYVFYPSLVIASIFAILWLNSEEVNENSLLYMVICCIFSLIAIMSY